MTSPLATPAFFFQHSNSLERLAVHLAAILAEQQRRAPLVPVTVTIPHPGVGIWLRQRLAAWRGAAANLAFQQPTELVWGLARETLGAEAVDRARGLDAEALTLGIYAALGRALEAEPEALAPIAAYLARAGRRGAEKAQMGLAGELARGFRDLVIYRPAWIDAWSHGRTVEVGHGAADERWQRVVWRAVWEAASEGRPEENPGGLLERLLAASPPPHPLPGSSAPSGSKGSSVAPGSPASSLPDAPLILFGISHLPPIFIEVLRRASQARPVHLFMPSPCREYWGDALDERRRLRTAVAAVGRLPPDALTTRETLPNDLLASLGRMGQEFLWQVSERLEDQLPEPEAAGYREPEPTTRLGWLQRALLTLEAPRAPEALDLRHDDGSIALHACHSRLREVEVLHDQVLAWLDPNRHAQEPRFSPPLTARDILVVAPDIDAYAPFVRAVFGTRTQGQGPVPFNLSDRKPVDAHPIVQAFLELLDLPTSDFEAESVVALLETPATARRLGLSEGELARIRRWAAELHVHWGIDAAHRRERGVGELPAVNSWRHGLDRLLFGLASMQEERVLTVGGAAILPWPEVEGSAAEAAGKLAAWVGRLDALRQRLRREDRTPGQWQRFLNQEFVEALFRPAADDGEEQAGAAAVREALDGLATAAQAAGVAAAPLPWSAVREHLRARLGEAVSQRRFLSRGVTFANTVPLRAVPARVVCMLGMNAGEFPRTSRPRAFDLLDRNREPGDRNARDEDRYLFLETILAAADGLYLSYLGRDQQENAEREPSPLVNELRGFFELAAAGARAPGEAGKAQAPVLATTEHPLQPFSPRNYQAGGGQPPQSYKREWLPAAEASRAAVEAGPGGRFFEPPAALPALPPPEAWPAVITLAELRAFFRSPARFYLERVLDVRLEDREAELRTTHELDALLQYRIGREVNQRAIDGDGARPEGWPDEAERLRGWLPGGRLARELVDREYRSDLVAFVRRLTDGEPATEVSVDLTLHPAGGVRPVRVIGTVEDVRGDHLVRWSATSMHGRRWMPILVDSAALACRGEPPAVAAVHGKNGTYETADPPPSLAGGRPRLLVDLVRLFLIGQHAPLVFFPETAWAWFEKAEDPEAAARAAARCFFPSSSAEHLAEAERCPYAATLTRGWTLEDLLCGQFQATATLVFGPGEAP